MDYSTIGFPILHYLLKFAQTHVHWVDDATQPSLPLSVTSFFCPQYFPASRSFPMSWLFTSGQIIGASALASSVLPMNIQAWFPLGLTGLISLLSKGLSRVFVIYHMSLTPSQSIIKLKTLKHHFHFAQDIVDLEFRAGLGGKFFSNPCGTGCDS